MGPELTGRVFELYVARLQFGLDGIFEGSGTDAFGCHVAIFGERLSDITMKFLRKKKLRGCSWHHGWRCFVIGAGVSQGWYQRVIFDDGYCRTRPESGTSPFGKK